LSLIPPRCDRRISAPSGGDHIIPYYGCVDTVDQARPLAISISTLIFNRPLDSNFGRFRFYFLADRTPCRIGQH
jgi:hypothetical protein